MIDEHEIVAYRQKGEWYTVEEVQRKRSTDRGAFIDAMPYTVAALRNRREYGRDVPEWVNLDQAED